MLKQYVCISPAILWTTHLKPIAEMCRNPETPAEVREMLRQNVTAFLQLLETHQHVGLSTYETYMKVETLCVNSNDPFMRIKLVSAMTNLSDVANQLDIITDKMMRDLKDDPIDYITSRAFSSIIHETAELLIKSLSAAGDFDT